MKKLFLALSSITFFARASEEVESMESEVSQALSDAMASLDWKTKVMLYWASLSTLHKIILVALFVAVVLWIVHKLTHCKKGSSCKCGCGGSCSSGCKDK